MSLPVDAATALYLQDLNLICDGRLLAPIPPKNSQHSLFQVLILLFPVTHTQALIVHVLELFLSGEGAGAVVGFR